MLVNSLVNVVDLDIQNLQRQTRLFNFIANPKCTACHYLCHRLRGVLIAKLCYTDCVIYRTRLLKMSADELFVPFSSIAACTTPLEWVPWWWIRPHDVTARQCPKPRQMVMTWDFSTWTL